MTDLSPEYTAAIEACDISFLKFNALAIAYRNREIGDNEFLAAKAEYNIAIAAFDAAFEIESTK